MAITNFKIFFKFRIIIRFFKDQKKSFFTFFFQEKNLVGFFCWVLYFFILKNSFGIFGILFFQLLSQKKRLLHLWNQLSRASDHEESKIIFSFISNGFTVLSVISLTIIIPQNYLLKFSRDKHSKNRNFSFRKMKKTLPNLFLLKKNFEKIVKNKFAFFSSFGQYGWWKA